MIYHHSINKKSKFMTTLFVLEITLLLLFGFHRTSAFLQLPSSTMLSDRVSSIDRCQWTKLYSAPPKPNQTNNNNKKHDYRSKYPTLNSFNDAMQQIANECSDVRRIKFDIISRAAVAEALLRTLEADVDAPYKPNIVTYNAIMKIWSKAAHVLAEGNGRGNINDVFHALDDVFIPEELMNDVKQIVSARDAALHASSILSSLETKYLTGESDVYPDCRGYSIVMDGWNKSRAKDSSEHVQKMFKRMKQWSTDGVNNVKSLGLTEDQIEEGLVHTEAKDWVAIKPNAVTYSITIESIRKESDNIVGDTDHLVKLLEKEYEENQDHNFKPDIGIANALIKSCLNNAQYISGRGGKHQKSMISMSWKTAKKIDEVYGRWNRKYKATGDVDYRPNISTVNMLIEAYARCGDIVATEMAQSVFDTLIKEWKETNDEQLKPTAKTFTAIITAWSKARDPRSPQKAEELLTLMEELFAEDAKQGLNSQLAPQSQTYTAAITTWARSLDNSKPQKALRILKKVIDMHKQTKDRRIQPTLFMYNAVIDACAKCYGTPEQQAKALEIAFAVNKAITAAKLQANHVTYATLLKAANALLVPGKEKNDIVKAVFTKCKKEGYVDIAVLKTLKMSADQNVFNELLNEARDKSGFVNFDLTPHDWSRNVK